MKAKIVEILSQAFESVYCDTCAYQDNEKYCDTCDRKSMNWAISEEHAEELAERITNLWGVST